MATTIKNPKTIQAKSRTHQVKQLANDLYEVTSGESGKAYSVRVIENGGHCSCDWAKYRPASGGYKSACSHVVSVFNFISEQADRRAMAWSDVEDAKRQHRPLLDIGDGVVLTTRKVGV